MAPGQFGCGPEWGDWGSGLEPDLPRAFCVTSCWLPPSSSVRLHGRVSSQLAKASNRCLYQEYFCENKWEVTMENTCLALVRCSVTSGNSVCDWTYFPVKFCLGDGNWDGTEKDGSGSHREYSLHWFWDRHRSENGQEMKVLTVGFPTDCTFGWSHSKHFIYCFSGRLLLPPSRWED